jgi:hypothetical protein
MTNILFVVVENLRQYRRSPLHQESVLHLVYESAQHNNGMHPSRNSAALKLKGNSGRVMPGVRPLISL